MKSLMLALICILSTLNVDRKPPSIEFRNQSNNYDVTVLKTKSITQSNLPDFHKMQATSERILNDLKRAKGILPDEPPRLVVKQLRGSQKIAVMSLEKNEIQLDILTYNICRNMGADSLDALAFIIGHELGHFIHQHGSINHNIEAAMSADLENSDIDSSFSNAANGANVKLNFSDLSKLYNGSYNEAEADFEGGFLGYLAGYNPMQAGKELIRRAYAHPFMNMNNVTKGYPTLQERLAIIENTASDLARLTPLFEMANYLVALEQYEDAIPYLEKILLKFKSREIYNNIGVIYLMETLRLFPQPITPYQFPLALDVDFRAPHPQFYQSFTRGFESWAQGMKKNEHCKTSFAQLQIEKAEEYFRKAIQLDKNYSHALLNLSIAQSIRGILYRGWECQDYKTATLSDALGTAYLAKDLVKKKMSNYWVEYYDQKPSDSIKHVSIKEFRNLAELRPFIIFKTDSLGDSVKIWVQPVYPFRKEFFRSFDWSTDLNWESMTSKYNKWSTPDSLIPSIGMELSNINMQIDLIKIFDDELKDGFLEVPFRFRINSRKIRPFTRALELFPQNKLALYNREISLGNRPDNNETIYQEIICDKKHLINGEALDTFVSQWTNWDFSEKLDASKLVSHFVSGQQILDEERNQLQREYVNLEQSMQYKAHDNYTLFSNRSKLSKDSREEITFVYRPNNPSNVIDDCSISVDQTKEELEFKYGPAHRTLQLSDGTYNVYATGVEHTLRMDTLPGASRRFSNIYVSDVSNKEDGIIFKINSIDKVTGWAIYHRSILTRNKFGVSTD